MNNDEKLKRLIEILQEYVKYLKTYKQVEVTVFTKTKLLVANYSTRKNEYGIDETICTLEDKKIEPAEYIKVKYYDVKLPYLSPNGFESIEFPIENIDRRIEHYRNKLKSIKEKNTQTIGN